MQIDKFTLLYLFGAGLPAPQLELVVINQIQREDGSNNHYNVTGIDKSGHAKTRFVSTK